MFLSCEEGIGKEDEGYGDEDEEDEVERKRLEERGRKKTDARRTLRKPYLFNCRTKLAKFQCLYMRDRIDFVNSFMSWFR